MEFVTVWNVYGIHVTIVEILPHILPLEDEEAAVEVAKAYTKRSVKVLAGHRVVAVETTEAGVKVTVSTEVQTNILEAEQALVAIGFPLTAKA